MKDTSQHLRTPAPLTQSTLLQIRDQMACLAWEDVEIAGLVAPQHGIISGLQTLIDDLDKLRAVDLGSIAPACGPR